MIKKFFNSGLIYIFGTILAKAMTFFLVSFYTRYFSTADYGISELLNNLKDLIKPLITLSVYESVLVFGLEFDGKKNVFKTSLGIICVGSLLLILMTPLSNFYRDYRWELTIFTITEGLIQLFVNNFKSTDKNGKFLLITVIQSLSTTILAILFTVNGFGAHGFMFAHILADLLTIFCALLFSRKQLVDEKFDLELGQQLIRFTIPLTLGNILFWILQYSDRLIIEHYGSVSSVGLYSAIGKLPIILFTLSGAIQHALTILTAKSNDRTTIKTGYAELQTFIFVAGSAMIVISKPLFEIYIGSQFAEGKNLVATSIAAMIFLCLSMFFKSIYIGNHRNKEDTLITIILSVINVLASFYSMIQFNIHGVVIKSLVIYFLFSTIKFIDCNRRFNLELNVSKYILCTTIIFGQIIFDNLFVRIVLFIILLGYNYKEIKLFLDTILKGIFKHA